MEKTYIYVVVREIYDDCGSQNTIIAFKTREDAETEFKKLVEKMKGENFDYVCEIGEDYASFYEDGYYLVSHDDVRITKIELH